MKLATYGLKFKKDDVNYKYTLLRALSDGVLSDDPYWFFALHPYGMTLRCLPKNTKKVSKVFKEHKIKFKLDKHFYEPLKHEYYGVHILGDELPLLLHALSVALVKHHPRISLYLTLERLNHMYVNMAGIHNFEREANLYLRLAEGRFKLVGMGLPYPKWLYKLWIKYFAKK